MEIVLENTSDVKNSTTTASTINSHFGTLSDTTHRPYRTALPIDGSPSLTATDYYSTLPPRGRTTAHHAAHSQPEFDIATSVRRVDKSGLLEIIELEPGRCSRPRHLTGAENPCHTATLTRRIDRTNRLEAVPEVPDQLQGQRSPESNVTRTTESGRLITERHLTGAEINDKGQSMQTNISLSPRAKKSSDETSIKVEENRASTPPSIHGVQSSSPYFRRGQLSPQPITTDKSPIQFNLSPNPKFPITTTMTLDSRVRQPYVDLTGATYTRAGLNSPIMISSRATSTQHEATTVSGDSDDTSRDRKQPAHDCLTRLSPRSRGQSPLTVSAIPDVIEAHGSRTTTALNTELDRDGAPKGQRAEAEGCEHTAIQSLEETRVSFKAPNKLLHNDNIQTLRVIILSEQL